MKEKFKARLIKLVIPALAGVITVLTLIPGEQGETALQVILEALKKIVGM